MNSPFSPQENFPRSKYISESYEGKSRFISYWRQIQEVAKLKPENVLEIGIGNGLASNYLREMRFSVTTVDFNENLKPDIVASVADLPLDDNSFDVVLCAEVLEHLPYEQFGRALGELRRVCRRGVVLSLPHWGVSLYFAFKIPLIGKKEIFKKISVPREHVFKGEHYWEIGKKGFPAKRIRSDMARAGFRIKKEINHFEDPAHRFFILETV